MSKYKYVGSRLYLHQNCNSFVYGLDIEKPSPTGVRAMNPNRDKIKLFCKLCKEETVISMIDAVILWEDFKNIKEKEKIEYIYFQETIVGDKESPFYYVCLFCKKHNKVTYNGQGKHINENDITVCKFCNNELPVHENLKVVYD